MRPLYSHPLESIPDELVQALAKLRGRLSQTPRAAHVKKTAAQAGLSAGPAVSEALLPLNQGCQVKQFLVRLA